MISPEAPSCQNVRGGSRPKTIQLPGIPGAFTNFYGPSKRVLRQTWPDGNHIFNIAPHFHRGGCAAARTCLDSGGGLAQAVSPERHCCVS